MALIPVITVDEQAANRALLNEATPAYDATTDPGGWDDGFHLSPNPARSDIAQIDTTLPAAMLVATMPDGTICDPIDLITADPPLYVIAVNAVNNPLELTPEMFGLSGNFTDGKWTFTLQLQGAFGPSSPQEGFEAQVTLIKYFYANVACCVDTLYYEANTCGDICKNKKLLAAQTADGWLQALIKAVDPTCEGGPKYNRADDILLRLQEICEGRCGCGC